MSNFVFIATSIDGFIARTDGSIDWLTAIPNAANDDCGYNTFIDSVDALVMGRNTFELVTTFPEWPYTVPVFVASTTLKALPEKFAGKAELIAGSPEAIVGALHARGYNNLYIDGGKTIQQFLAAGLIDELTITTIPIILGSGIPLFTAGHTEQQLELLGSTTWLNALVQNRYKVKHAANR